MKTEEMKKEKEPVSTSTVKEKKAEQAAPKPKQREYVEYPNGCELYSRDEWYWDWDSPSWDYDR